MTFSLTWNFFSNARGVTFADASGVTWAFDPATNKITANASTGGASSGNPTASVGLAAVNGSAGTWMRSDAAPALSQAISPTWTGNHAFTGATGAGYTVSVTNTGAAAGDTARVTINADNGSTAAALFAAPVATSTPIVTGGPTGAQAVLRTLGSYPVVFGTANKYAGQFDINQNMLVAKSLGLNGVAAPAQVTGFGTPVGGAVVASYNISDAGGANSNTNKCVAEILTILKAYGMIAA